jgi:hypothetical protein
MRSRRRPRTTWLERLLRGRRLDRNPLRRRSDRAETALLALLLAVFLAGAPFVANAAGSWTYTSSLREQQAQSAVVHHVPATLLQAAPDWSMNANPPEELPETNARWTAPEGQVHTGQVYAPSGAAAGSTVMVWVNQAGQLTDPPLQSSQVASRAVLDETLAVAALAIMLIVVGRLGHWALDKRRLAAWGADWLATGPRWSSRR